MAKGGQLPVAGSVEQHDQRLLRAWNAATPEECEQLAAVFAARSSEGSREIAALMREMAEQIRTERGGGSKSETVACMADA
jgi:hypothetical protein